MAKRDDRLAGMDPEGLQKLLAELLAANKATQANFDEIRQQFPIQPGNLSDLIPDWSELEEGGLLPPEGEDFEEQLGLPVFPLSLGDLIDWREDDPPPGKTGLKGWMRTIAGGVENWIFELNVIGSSTNAKLELNASDDPERPAFMSVDAGEEERTVLTSSGVSDFRQLATVAAAGSTTAGKGTKERTGKTTIEAGQEEIELPGTFGEGAFVTLAYEGADPCVLHIVGYGANAVKVKRTLPEKAGTIHWRAVR